MQTSDNLATRDVDRISGDSENQPVAEFSLVRFSLVRFSLVRFSLVQFSLVQWRV
jgi:hypothetical protein